MERKQDSMRSIKNQEKKDGWVLAHRKWTRTARILVLTAVLMGGVFVWLQTQQIADGYRIVQLQTKYRKALSLHRKLELSWNRLRSPYALERLARDQLKMTPPTANRIILCPRLGRSK